jgi:hypothetical protein
MVNIININLFLLYPNMFKNWFRSANEKRMEEQIAKLKEDIKVLQTKLSLLEKRDELIVTSVDELLEPRSEVVSNLVEVSNVVKLSDVLELEESPTVEEEPKVVDVVTPIIEEEHKVVVEEKANVVEIVAEPKTIEEPKVVAEEKVIAEEKPTVVAEPKTIEEPKVVAEEKIFKKEEKETNHTPTPKKRRQSKKAAQLEEALPK